MFTAIFTHPKNTGRRTAIRSTWALPGGVAASFVMCRDPAPSSTVTEEAERYKDIVFVGCTEGYRRGLLTRKVLAVLRYFDEHYDAQTPFFYKVDDDAFPDLHELLEIVRGVPPPVYAGTYDGRSPVHYNTGGKWEESDQAYSGALFPESHPGGPGYVLGRSLVGYFLRGADTERHLLWNEDKAVAVWVGLARDAGIKVSWVNVSGRDAWCDAQSDLKFTLNHRISTSQMYCIARRRRLNDTLGPCFCNSLREDGTPRLMSEPAASDIDESELDSY